MADPRCSAAHRLSAWLLGGLLAANLAGAGSVAASPALVFDAESGRVLYAEDVDREWFPASLTKMMTAYVVFEAVANGEVTLETRLGITPKAFFQPPTRMGIAIGRDITIDLAVRALIVKSANDFAVALAEAIGGGVDEFVVRMNETAIRLGMTHTRFANPHGLPSENQMTTARDMGILGRALFRDFPQHAHMFSDRMVQVGRITAVTHNSLLLSLEGADGVKTGFTCAAGYNIVASASRNGQRMIAVVLGEASGADRAIRAAHLIEHGFRTFGWKTLFPGPLLETLPFDVAPEFAPDFSRSARIRKCDAPAAIARVGADKESPRKGPKVRVKLAKTKN